MLFSLSNGYFLNDFEKNVRYLDRFLEFKMVAHVDNKIFHRFFVVFGETNHRRLLRCSKTL
jgi:hypothetical protein